MKWIKCSESMPYKEHNTESGCTYLVAYEIFLDSKTWLGVDVVCYHDEEGGWHGNDLVDKDKITHWMPLPHPPKDD